MKRWVGFYSSITAISNKNNNLQNVSNLQQIQAAHFQWFTYQCAGAIIYLISMLLLLLSSYFSTFEKKNAVSLDLDKFIRYLNCVCV